MTVRREPRQGHFRGVRTPDLRKRARVARKRRSAPQKPLRATCRKCGKRFFQNPKQASHKFCSATCRKRAWEEKRAMELLISALKKTLEKMERP